MVDANGRSIDADDRIVRLTRAYHAILARYAEIEQLSGVERDLLLSKPNGIAGVNAILGRKRIVLAEIREEEEKVKSAREWWKKARRALPADAGRELLSLLDGISRAVERLLAIESECHRLLERRTAWGNGEVAEPSLVGARLGAQAAYGQAVTAGRSAE